MKTFFLVLVGFAAVQICHAEDNAQVKLPTGDEFTALRMSYAAHPDFNPMWKSDEARVAIMDALKAKDYAKVATLSKPWLEKVPVDADMHFLRAQVLKRAGDWEGFSYHFHCFYGLIHSIVSSGDGKTLKTAFKVISVSEEYSFLDEIGAQLIKQALEYPCDRMQVKLRDGTEATFYFDVSISFAATARMLKPTK